MDILPVAVVCDHRRATGNSLDGHRPPLQEEQWANKKSHRSHTDCDGRFDKLKCYFRFRLLFFEPPRLDEPFPSALLASGFTSDSASAVSFLSVAPSSSSVSCNSSTASSSPSIDANVRAVP